MKSLSLVLLSLITFATGANAAVVINEIDLANNRVELVNTGASAVDISTWWWCNRVNGSPFYQSVGSNVSVIDNSLSTVGATKTNFAAGATLVMTVDPDFLPDVNGEFSIYNTNSFTSAAAIEDYVLWGSVGIRDIVAQNAGLWTDNQSIDISGLGAGQTLQANLGTTGNGPSEWFLADSTLGSANIPEPTAALMGLLGFALIFRRRK
ncbi:MAG: hypothetical protein AAGA58_13030 [Verrucomicrobiota bacterium]